MWVLVNKPYAGDLGLYPGDQKHDLDEKTIIGLRKELGKENVVDTCAPEDEHVDKKANAKTEAIEKAKAAITDVERMQAEMVGLRKVAARINALKKEIEDGTEKAKRLAKAAGIDWPKKA
jgi:hypothetical protein